MNIFVIHAHTANRGDEAAVKAMIDEILRAKPDTKITIAINGDTFYPAMDKRVTQIGRFPKPHSVLARIEYPIFMKSSGKICCTNTAKKFKKALKEADLVVHAPGGPSIGDIYINAEKAYLDRLELAQKFKKKYMFYAPSMGPFNNDERNIRRRKILLGAEKVILRDPISFGFVKEFCPECHPVLALDSAFQHEVDTSLNESKLHGYTELYDFMNKHEKNIGITITDLKWHPKYGKTKVYEQIRKTFEEFVTFLDTNGYGIIFIPQLYGSGNDSDLMSEFSTGGNGFVMEANSDIYDTYFQQYVIGKLYAVVGMRYHSNIFSAKMGTPFVSISYEQKMKGFMEKMGLPQYCIPVESLTESELKSKFNDMISSYEEYKNLLENKHEEMLKQAYSSTEAVLKIFEENDRRS